MKEEEYKSFEEYQEELNELLPKSSGGFKKIACPSCSEEVPAENLNINDKIAKCNSCHVVFPFHEEVAALVSRKQVKQDVIRPEGIDLFYFNGELDICLQQPVHPADIILISLMPFVAFMITMVYITKGTIPIIWPALAWLVTAYPIMNLINRKRHKIHITLDDEHLHVERRPKRMYKDKQYSIREIDQIYVKGSSAACSVYMVVNGVDGQKHVPLITGLTNLIRARYLEQEIERHLGIEDRQIPGEAV